MTIPEIAAQLRMVFGACAKADANVSPAERIYFAAAQNDCSDEEIISFWLAVSSLEEHQVPMFVAKHWAKRARESRARFAHRSGSRTGNNGGTALCGGEMR